MSVVDTIVVGTLAIGLLLGLLRGFLAQVTGLLGLLGGLLLAARYHGPLRRNVFDPYVGTSHNGEIAFISIVVFTVLVTAIFGWLLRKAVERLELGAYDRLMGAAFGVIKAGLICAGILLAIVTFAPEEGGIERAIGSSRAGPMLWRAMHEMATVLPEKYRDDVVAFLEKNALPVVPGVEPEPAAPLRTKAG